jgi:hypothetical protein
MGHCAGWGNAARGRGYGDVRTSDVALGLLAAVLVLGSTAAALATIEPSQLDEPAASGGPEALAVPVRSVSSLEARLADEPIAASLAVPSAAVSSSTPHSGGLRAAAVPPRPDDAPPPVSPDALPERPRGGIRGLPRLHPPARSPLPTLGDEPGFGPGGPAVVPGTADPATSPRDPYAYVDPATEDPTATGLGVVSDDEGDGGADPRAARAVAIYRDRLQRWLSQYFYVADSGLSREARRKARVRATIELGDDLTVVGFTVAAGGHPALEAGARAALEAVVGQRVPELPEHYPGPLQRSIKFVFTCTEQTCH